MKSRPPKPPKSGRIEPTPAPSTWRRFTVFGPASLVSSPLGSLNFCTFRFLHHPPVYAHTHGHSLESFILGVSLSVFSVKPPSSFPPLAGWVSFLFHSLVFAPTDVGWIFVVTKMVVVSCSIISMVGV